MTITLPLPAKALHPNFRSRSHWPKTRALKKAREEAYLRALVVAGGKHKAPRWETALAHATFYFKTNRRRDEDGAAASLKAYWDGIADAGIVQNDSGLRHQPVLFAVDPKAPRVELRILEVPV